MAPTLPIVPLHPISEIYAAVLSRTRFHSPRGGLSRTELAQQTEIEWMQSDRSPRSPRSPRSVCYYR